MTETREADLGLETGYPRLEWLLDRHQAELMEQADYHHSTAKRRHREIMEAFADMKKQLDVIQRGQVAPFESEINAMVADLKAATARVPSVKPKEG